MMTSRFRRSISINNKTNDASIYCFYCTTWYYNTDIMELTTLGYNMELQLSHHFASTVDSYYNVMWPLGGLLSLKQTDYMTRYLII